MRGKWVKKKTFNKTIACLTILYEVYFNVGACTAKYFCDKLDINRFLFYDYVAEINAFFSEFLTIEGYSLPYSLKYDNCLKKYVIVLDTEEKN